MKAEKRHHITRRRESSIEPETFRFIEFCAKYRIGRTSAYEEIKAGRLKAYKMGRMTMIAKSDAQSWLEKTKAQNPFGG